MVDVLHAKPEDWQREALEALGNGHNTAVRSGHGVGKTTLLAWVVLWWLCTRDDAKVPCTAPTERQLLDILWPEISLWVRRGELQDWVNWTATRVAAKRSPTTVFAVARTASTVEALAGFHADHLIYIVDEASGIADEMYLPVQGALSTEGALLLVVGNPTRGDGYFAKRFSADDPRWRAITVNAEDVERVSRGSIKAWADEYGPDSDEYRVRVLGLPPIGEATGFISGQLVRDARNLPPAEPEGRLEMGVDVARYGDDASAIVARRGWRVVYMDRRRKLSNPDVAAWAAEVMAQFNPGVEKPVIRVDDTGVGGGVTDLLRQAARDGNFTVQAMNFGGEGDGHYQNATGIWWANVRKQIQSGMPLPDDDDLARQLTDRLYTMNAKGKVVLESKEHMKARGVPSPDVADAFVMAFHTAMGQGAAFMAAYRKELTDRDAAGPVEPAELRALPRMSTEPDAVAPLRPGCQHRWWAEADGSAHCVNCGGAKPTE